MNPFFLAGALVAYCLACRLVLRGLTGWRRELGLAVANLAGLYWLLRSSSATHAGGIPLAVYVGLVGFQFACLRGFAKAKGSAFWLAFAAPIGFLIWFHYVPAAWFNGLLAHFVRSWRGQDHFVTLAGLSYLAFRCSRLALEVRNGAVALPGLLEYFNFAFFLPTMSVGPINTYANYRRGFEATPWDVPVGRAGLRILVGLVKYQIFSAWLNPLTYQGLLLNEHVHHWIDLPVAMVGYYLFLYCNFSGSCDIAIGMAGWIGIPVLENFDNPLAARNMREFWNRWHITLSQWMRDIVFAPLSKSLVGWFGPARANHAVAVAIAVVFLLVGIWHGAGWNYALFGLAQSLGVVVVHYYTLFLKQRLGREGFKAYNENRWIHRAAVVVTFCYYAATLFLFANSLDDMKRIFSVLQ